MTSARQRRHRRSAPAPARRDPRRLGALVVLAGVSALGAVAGPVAGSGSGLPARAEVGALTVPDGGAVASFSTGQQQLRSAAAEGVSRDQDRAGSARALVSAAPEVATPEVVSPLAVPESTPAYAQDDTVAVSEPASSATVLVEIDRGDPLAVTGRTDDGFAEVVLDNAVAWVAADDLGPQGPAEPVEPAEPPDDPGRGDPAELSGSTCAGGTGVESGLSNDTVAVHRAVCAQFPGLVYGGLRPGDPGEHGSGLALDIMVSGSRGDEVAAFLQDHAVDLGIDNLIWEQRIWYVGTSPSAWDGMQDRGSVTANHFDHVHVGTR